MANVVEETVTPPEESGGVVTTVKKNVTSDVDVQAQIDAAAAEGAAEEEGKDKQEDKKGEVKPEAKADGKAKDDKDWFSQLPEGPVRKQAEKLFADLRAAKREGRETRAQLQGIQSELDALKRKSAKPATEAKDLFERRADGRPIKPNPLDFKDQTSLDAAEEAYDDAIYEWRQKKEEADRRAQSVEEENQTALTKYNEDVKEYAKENPTYHEDVECEVPLTQTMFGMMIEHGPWLTHWFALHPDESEKIAEMGNTRKAEHAILEIVFERKQELKAKSKEKKDEEPPKQKKPAPPATVGGGGSAPVKPRAQKSFKEVEAELRRQNPGMVNYT